MTPDRRIGVGGAGPQLLVDRKARKAALLEQYAERCGVDLSRQLVEALAQRLLVIRQRDGAPHRIAGRQRVGCFSHCALIRRLRYRREHPIVEDQIERDVVAVPTGVVQTRREKEEVAGDFRKGAAHCIEALVVDECVRAVDETSVRHQGGRQPQIKARAGNIDTAMHVKRAQPARCVADPERAAQQVVAEKSLLAVIITRHVHAAGRDADHSAPTADRA